MDSINWVLEFSNFLEKTSTLQSTITISGNWMLTGEIKDKNMSISVTAKTMAMNT